MNVIKWNVFKRCMVCLLNKVVCYFLEHRFGLAQYKVLINLISAQDYKNFHFVDESISK